MKLGAFFVLAAAVGCSSSDHVALGIGGATIETTLPVAAPLSIGSSSVVKDGSNLVIIVSNVRDAQNGCQPANVSATENVAGLFELELVVPNAVSPSGDVIAGIYGGVTATYRITDEACASIAPPGPYVVARAEVDDSSGSFSGAAAVDITGVGRIVTTFLAPTCDALPATSAPSGCVKLPSCTATPGLCM